jgi:hypothetical protein
VKDGGRSRRRRRRGRKRRKRKSCQKVLRGGAERLWKSVRVATPIEAVETGAAGALMHIAADLLRVIPPGRFLHHAWDIRILHLGCTHRMADWLAQVYHGALTTRIRFEERKLAIVGKKSRTSHRTEKPSPTAERTALHWMHSLQFW